MPAISMTFQPYRLEIGLLYNLFERKFIDLLLSFLKDNTNEISNKNVALSEQLQNIVVEYEKIFRYLAKSKTPEQVSKRLKESLIEFFNLNHALNELILNIEESILDGITEASQTIASVLEEKEGSLPKLYLIPLQQAHERVITTMELFIDHLSFLIKQLPELLQHVKVSPDEEKEAVFRKVLQEGSFDKNLYEEEIKKISLTDTQYYNVAQSMIMSSLAFQMTMFTSLEIHNNNIEMPPLPILDSIITETINHSKIYQSTCSEFWHEIFVSLFMDKLSDLSNAIRGIYVRGLSGIDAIIIDVPLSIEKQSLFKIYELEENILGRLSSSPKVDVLFEPDSIPSGFQVVSQRIDAHE